jgi:hypothetical protein
MELKPFTKTYQFSDEILVDTYPRYLADPIKNWLREVLEKEDVFYQYEDFRSDRAVRPEFVDRINVLLREDFPRSSPDRFLDYVLESTERTTEILNLCLQNYADVYGVARLERILEVGGSAYSAMLTHPNPQNYHKGIGEIVQRVPEIILSEG